MLPQAFVLCLNYLELTLSHTLVSKFLGPNPKQNIQKKAKKEKEKEKGYRNVTCTRCQKQSKNKGMILFFNCKKKLLK
jgi:hypothetical protein